VNADPWLWSEVVTTVGIVWAVAAVAIALIWALFR